MTAQEEYMDEIARLQQMSAEQSKQLAEANETIELLEDVIHKAAKLAGHIPYLCSTLAERSTDLEQTALQLQNILTRRRV